MYYVVCSIFAWVAHLYRPYHRKMTSWRMNKNSWVIASKQYTSGSSATGKIYWCTGIILVYRYYITVHISCRYYCAVYISCGTLRPRPSRSFTFALTLSHISTMFSYQCRVFILVPSSYISAMFWYVSCISFPLPRTGTAGPPDTYWRRSWRGTSSNSNAAFPCAI